MPTNSPPPRKRKKHHQSYPMLLTMEPSLGKLLSDEETGSPFLYLMSEDMEIVLDAYVRIRGPEMELIFEGLPDDSGAVDLSGLPEFDPGDSHVEIVMPEMTIKLEPRTLHDRLVGKKRFSNSKSTMANQSGSISSPKKPADNTGSISRD